jgi:hypothetical protein
MKEMENYSNWVRKQDDQLINSLDGKKVKETEKTQVLIKLRDVVEQLFDNKGRRIFEGLQTYVCDSNKKFKLNQPELKSKKDFQYRIDKLHNNLNINTWISNEEFKEETEGLLQLIKKNPQISNLAKAVYLPIVIPKMITNDFGSELELYLLAINHSYRKLFSNRKFNNFCHGVLAGQVNMVEESRQDKLFMKIKKDPVVGLFFPNSLQGFSINAGREQMKTLPARFILSGLDTAIAIAMYPDILTDNFKTPSLDLAALQWQSLDRSFYFRANDDELHFDVTVNLIKAIESSSSGLLFLR